MAGTSRTDITLNFSGKTYKIVPYGVTQETETIDYDELEQIAERENARS